MLLNSIVAAYNPSLAPGQKPDLYLYYTPPNNHTNKVIEYIKQRYASLNDAECTFYDNVRPILKYQGCKTTCLLCTCPFPAFDNEAALVSAYNVEMKQAADYCHALGKAMQDDQVFGGQPTECFVPILGAIVFDTNFSLHADSVSYTMRWPTVKNGIMF